mmetsp:Transcript_9511/g.10227  ORF Transcript_9511/g.10227 Transcript_9511/m.10227 type:complete len:244 (+) Transcript_9511:100-831(+)|eukprot:CAMPEP_0173133882 /NCGR_PEP_ID=MMETSP1105-20130129/972_1 /TAXON_ID=2985 /ORGANISM="Ochromonas sp., Strain BG-1" /LENGTH=243 /DNA_ID=CAMNT_0014045597 /DNA_START=90 /DNA_END=821 /DNA_ORIENTATION=-
MSDPTEPTPTSLKKRKVAISAAIAEAARASTNHDSDSDSPASTPMVLNTSIDNDSFYADVINKKPARVREKRSEVWRYFEIQELSNNGHTIRIGKCKNCPYYGKYSSSTSFMKDHLRKCKGIVYSGNLNGSFTDGEATIPEADVKADDGNVGENTHSTTIEYKPRKTRLTSLKPSSELNFTAVWEYINDTRRAKYPKALNALLEDLGVFEVSDLKSLDFEQFEILASLLKPAPQKSFNELIFR